MTLLSGLSGPLGALVGLVALKPFITARGVADVEACVAGVMGWLALAELLPEARAHRRPASAAAGALAGWFVMMWTMRLLH